MKKFRQIIFIDDDAATNFYHQIIVEQSNMCEEFIFFNRPLEALDHFKNIEANADLNLPDVIFLDINMPLLNGWGFLEKFAELNFNKPPFVLMLTTSLNPRDQERAESSPLIKGIIDKPLKEDNLKLLLDQLNSLENC